MLSAYRIGKKFENGTKALDAATLNVARGEFLSLVGPSGCGKSTILRIIAGLLSPSEGSVAWPEGKPEIGFVFQEPTLMPWANAQKNVRIGLELKGTNGSEADTRAADALARVGLSGFEKAYPRELSGGMKMRVSLARALVTKPKLLLMDEPFAALDEFTREALNDDLLKLWREDGLTVIFVTHSVYESCYLSTRIAVMSPRPGRVMEEITLFQSASRDAGYRLSPQFAENAHKVSAVLRHAMSEGA